MHDFLQKYTNDCQGKYTTFLNSGEGNELPKKMISTVIIKYSNNVYTKRENSKHNLP